MTANFKPQPVNTDDSLVQSRSTIRTAIAQQFGSCTLFHCDDASPAQAFTASAFRQDVRQALAQQFTFSIFH